MEKFHHYPRPVSVTIISTILLLRGCFGFLFSLTIPARRAMGDVIPFWISLFALLIIFVVCGAFMLRGDNWARILFFAALLPGYVAFTIVAFCNRTPTLDDDLSSLPGSILLHLIVLAVTWALLVSLDANLYFFGRSTFFKKRKKSRSQNTDPEPKDGTFNY